MKRFNIILLFLTLTQTAFSLQFNGVVKDVNTDEAIPYAGLNLVDLGMSLYCDSLGSFSVQITTPKKMNIIASAFGYESKQVEIDLKNGSSIEIKLTPAHIEFEELIVSSHRNSLQNQTIANIASRSLKDLKMLPSGTLSDMISNIPGVYQSTTGRGLSKPVIRGLSQNRVVTYLNGLRIENQQWGGDHGIGVSDIGIGRVEIIKGPASLLYGSDALGGVLYLVDEPYADVNSIETFVNTEFESASMGFQNQAGFKISKKAIRFNLFADNKLHADYQLPSGKYALDSRYKESNIKASLGFNKNNWVSNLRYNYLQNRVGIPGHTHDTVINPENFIVGEQVREDNIPAQLNRNNYALWENKFLFESSKLTILLGHTANTLQEFEEKRTVPGLAMNLNTTSYNLKWNKDFSAKSKLALGAQGMYQKNENDLAADSRLIPDATTIDNGVYGLFGSSFKTIAYELGLRFDTRKIETFDNQNGISKTYNSINFSAGLAKFDEKYTLKGNLSTGFRAPHTSELLANGVHHGALRHELGNANLKSEQAIQADVYYELKSEHLNFIVNPFINQISNYIGLQNRDTLVGGLPSFAYVQIDNALLIGGDIGFHYHPHFAHFLHLESSYSYVYGAENANMPLTLIPQPRINSSVKIEIESDKKLMPKNIVVQHQYMFKQNRVGQYETKSTEYNVVHAALNFEFGNKLKSTISLGMRNLLNENFIDHLSRLKNIDMASPGRNVFVKLKLNINHQLKQKQ